MNKKRLVAFLIAGGTLTAAMLQPTTVIAGTTSDVQHLVKALTKAGTMTVADDYNGDGKVNALDLTLLKRELLAPADDGEVKKQTIPATADTVKLISRTVALDGAQWLVQSGAAVECLVTGTEASVTIVGDGNVKNEEKWRPRYGVWVDDELVADVVMGEAEQVVKLFQSTKSKTVKVKVMHLSEANNGAIGVKQFDVTSGAAKPVKPTAKKDLTVEFIGDSITCAYGVEAETQYVGFETGTENFSLSYAYLTAQLLDADYSTVAYSGHGIISGYSNDGMAQTDSLVPPVYEQVGKFDPYLVAWDFAANPVDVVVLNLGTNDDSYATKDLETRGLEYQEGYVKFLKQIRKNNPKAAIVCTLGIMGCEELYPYIEAAVEACGDKNVFCYQSPTQKMTDGLGADWHPSPKTHELNSYLLADKICTAIGRESNKIGIDMALEGEYGADIDKEDGASAWPYFNDYDRSLSVSVMSAGSKPEAITGYVRNLPLIAGGYELCFTVSAPAGVSFDYALRSVSDSGKVYASGTMKGTGDNVTVTEAFSMDKADDCEIVFLLGEIATGSIVIRDLTLYKKS